MATAETYYRYETAGGCLIVTLLPELNDKQWADIERVGTEVVDRIGATPSPRLLVDLTSLTYMGSAMVALIVRLYKAINGRNGRMAVVNHNELVLEVLKLAGLTKLWTIVESRERGLSALGVSARAAAAATSDGPVVEGEKNGLLIGGILCALGAVIGLALQFAPSHPVSPKTAQIIAICFAALGLVVGTMLLVNQSGARRNIGIALLAVCLLVILGGLVAAPAPAPAGPPAGPATTATTGSTVAPPASVVPSTAAAAPVAPAAAATPPAVATAGEATKSAAPPTAEPAAKSADAKSKTANADVLFNRKKER